jgi:hypothetical protein
MPNGRITYPTVGNGFKWVQGGLVLHNKNSLKYLCQTSPKMVTYDVIMTIFLNNLEHI